MLLNPESMVRNECSHGNIQVAFGHDKFTGYFISVYDTRLQGDEDDGSDFDDIRYAISADGCGAYLEAHTGSQRIGRRVIYGTMQKLWRSYEVGEEGMALLAKGRGSVMDAVYNQAG